jgi:hypothetical protein
MVARVGAKPLIRVESGGFVGRFGDREYALGSWESGLARAIRRMSEIRGEIQAKVAGCFEALGRGEEGRTVWRECREILALAGAS